MKILYLHNDSENKILDVFEIRKDVESTVVYPSIEDISSRDFNFDIFLSTTLNQEIEKEYDLIIIPFNLSKSNYLELIGLRVATHIRLTPELCNQRTPILFLGQESKEQIAKLSDLGSILFTSGIFATSKTKEADITSIIEWIGNWGKLSKEQLTKCIDRIDITPPGNYDSRHSIANVWGLSMLDKAFDTNLKINKYDGREELTSSLYFKSKMIIDKSDGIITREPRISLKKRNILLIEDEWNRGWKDFYEALFPNSTLIHVPFVKGMSKKETLKEVENTYKKEILKEVENTYKKVFWDLILLDIRLCDEDHTTDEYIEYSGFEVLEYLIDEDPYNSIILTSASNKHQIYNYGKQSGALSFLVKPGIESVEAEIEGFKAAVIKADDLAELRKSIEVFNSFYRELKPEINTLSLVSYIQNESKVFFDLSIDFYKEDKLDFCFFNLFAILEGVCSRMTDDCSVVFPQKKPICKKNWKDKKVDWLISFNKNIRTNKNTVDDNYSYYSLGEDTANEMFLDISKNSLASISSVYAFALDECKDDDYLKDKIGKIVSLRNRIAHGERKIIKQNEIKMILKVLVALKFTLYKPKKELSK